MKLSFHNSAFVRGPSRLVSVAGSWAWQVFPILYGVFEHPTQGLVLIDTGYSQALFESRDAHVRLYRALLRPKLLAEGDALKVVESMGGKANDIRHIILTHLHADHMCGLERFPQAMIHASALSLAGWKNPRGFSSTHQGFFTSLLPPLESRNTRAVETAPAVPLPWGGTGHDIFNDGSVLSVDLPGHMKGHIGLAFPQLPQPIFHAADADWTLKSLNENLPPPLPARLIMANTKDMRASRDIARRAEAHGYKITLCHDL